MTWSTRELADLAGTTVNTVRHYHRLGLLDEPRRRYNGYKQYTVQDLVQLLRLRRLAELSVPLSRIKQVCTRGEIARDDLLDVDIELHARIERLQRARDDIDTILTEDAPPDSPSGFASVASRMSESDNSIIHIYTQLYDADAMTDIRRMVEVDADEAAVGAEISALPPDADEETRKLLAERLAPTLVRNLIEHPWLNDPARHLCKNARVAKKAFVEAVSELYNSAQLDVLRRASLPRRDAPMEHVRPPSEATALVQAVA